MLLCIHVHACSLYLSGSAFHFFLSLYQASFVAKMLSISLFTIVFFLADLAWCSSKFLRPPEWDDNVDTIGDMGNNVQFKDGDTVQFRWETDLDDFQLIIVQVLDDREIFGKFQCKISPIVYYLLHIVLIQVASTWGRVESSVECDWDTDR